MKELRDPYSLIKVTVISAVVIAFSGLLIWTFVIMIPYNYSRQTEFNLRALGRYLDAYEQIEDTTIRQLSDFPEFTIISAAASLSFNSKEIHDGIAYKYIYDMRRFDDGRYIISASPIGIFTPPVELAILDDGKVRFNNLDADPDPDSYQEAQYWSVVYREEFIRTLDLPKYF